MDDGNNNNRAALSDPKLNSIAEASLKAIDTLRAHYIIVRHFDMVALSSRKTYYDEAARRSSIGMNTILLSTTTSSGDDDIDPFEEAFQVLTALKQVKETSTKSVEKRVCEHIDLADASLQPIFHLHKHYKVQIRHHRL